MLTLLTAAQMRQVDSFTIAHTPINSIDLMEQAASAFVACFLSDGQEKNLNIAVFCGLGNNGGDGLAIARLLYQKGYRQLKVFLVNFYPNRSADCLTNLNRLIAETSITPNLITTAAAANKIEADIFIDAILGSGLNRPAEGELANLITIINQKKAKVYAVDVPSGFVSDGLLTDTYRGIKACKTICFQRPKINFFMPESAKATASFEVVEIGLNENFIQAQESDFFLITKQDIQQLLKPRLAFTHKGSYGHALIIAGATQTMGAAILASSGCLHSGAGLVTACIPQSGLTALNVALPEVMALLRDEKTNLLLDGKYKAIAIGPGLGTEKAALNLLESLILAQQALIIDADAINILAERPDLCQKLAPNTVLTPHVKEFDRLWGYHQNWPARLNTAKAFAQKMQLVVVLKNQYTFICGPNGKVYINSTGNPAMAQGGMGDVLTGLIAGFVAQGHTALNASILACFVHGFTGDLLAAQHQVVAASLLAKNISKSIKILLK